MLDRDINPIVESPIEALERPDYPFYLIEIGDTRVPLPVVNYAGAMSNDGQVVAVYADSGDVSITFSTTDFSSPASSFGFSYKDIIDQSFKRTVAEVNCEAEESIWRLQLVGLFMKEAHLPFFDVESVYRAEWGWLFHGLSRGDLVWEAWFMLDDSKRFAVSWRVPEDMKHFGALLSDQTTLNGNAPESLRELADCIEQEDAECLHSLGPLTNGSFRTDRSLQ